MQLILETNLIILGVMGAFALVLMTVCAMFGLLILPLWLQAYLSGTRISFLQIVGMRLRLSPARAVVTAQIMCSQAGLKPPNAPTTPQLESHAITGTDIVEVVKYQIKMMRIGKEVSFEEADSALIKQTDTIPSN